MPEQTSAPAPMQSKSLFPKQVVKTGVMFGIAIGVLNLFYIVTNLIPILGILLSLLISVVAFALSVAAGYVVVNAMNIRKENVSDAVMKSVMTGLIVGVIVGLASGVTGVVTNLIWYSGLTGIFAPTIVTYVFSFVGSFVVSVILNVVWAVVGGVVGVYYPSSNLPAGVKTWSDKAVERANA